MEKFQARSYGALPDKLKRQLNPHVFDMTPGFSISAFASIVQRCCGHSGVAVKRHSGLVGRDGVMGARWKSAKHEKNKPKLDEWHGGKAQNTRKTRQN